MLEAELVDARRARTDKDEVLVGNGAGKAGVFGEEAIAWDDGLCTDGLGEGDDLVAVQVGPRGVTSEQVGFIRVGDVLGCRVWLRVDCYGPYA